MTRRGFFAMLGGLAALPFVPKKPEKPKCFVGVDTGFGDDFTATIFFAGEKVFFLDHRYREPSTWRMSAVNDATNWSY